MTVDIGPYDPERDHESVHRMWLEISWVSDSDDPAILSRFVAAGRADVARIDGAAECLVHRMPGTMRYQEHDLPLCAVTAVTVSPVARRRGLATSMTAGALAEAASDGAAVAALGIFDQGFYDRLGFGSAGYQALATFDPANLRLDHLDLPPPRPPVRLTAADHAEIDDLVRRRHRSHGAVVLHPPEYVRAQLEWISQPIGLGYRDGDRLTHVLFGKRNGDHGPHRIIFLAYEEPAQLLELLRLLGDLSDQVTTVRLLEPAGIQLQDLLATPFRDRQRTTGSEHATGLATLAWWQLRILDLEAAVAAHRSVAPPLRFNLTLSDPLADVRGAPWSGIGGDHVVTIGADSTVEPGTDPAAPRLTATVNAFSRLWFGVGSASSLSVTDHLSGPPELMTALDRSLVVPSPVPDLEF